MQGALALTKNDKLLQKFLQKPKDFTWEQYCKIFTMFGFELKSGNGSRRSFVNEDGDVFYIHEPHPQNVMKPYTIKEAIEFLSEKGYLPVGG